MWFTVNGWVSGLSLWEKKCFILTASLVVFYPVHLDIIQGPAMLLTNLDKLPTRNFLSGKTCGPAHCLWYLLTALLNRGSHCSFFKWLGTFSCYIPMRRKTLVPNVCGTPSDLSIICSVSCRLSAIFPSSVTAKKVTEESSEYLSTLSWPSLEPWCSVLFVAYQFLVSFFSDTVNLKARCLAGACLYPASLLMIVTCLYSLGPAVFPVAVAGFLWGFQMQSDFSGFPQCCQE